MKDAILMVFPKLSAFRFLQSFVPVGSRYILFFSLGLARVNGKRYDGKQALEWLLNEASNGGRCLSNMIPFVYSIPGSFIIDGDAN